MNTADKLGSEDVYMAADKKEYDATYALSSDTSTFTITADKEKEGQVFITDVHITHNVEVYLLFPNICLMAQLIHSVNFKYVLVH